MRRASEGTLWTDAGSSCQPERKERRRLSSVLLVAAIGISIGRRSRVMIATVIVLLLLNNSNQLD